jgi:uncharacterized protein (UPF0332 family)
LYVSAVNRLYYAAFYAATAMLQVRGATYGKHSALRVALHRDLVKTGVIPKETGECFDRLFEDRQSGDYVPATTFQAEDVARLADGTCDLIERAKRDVDKHQ